MVNPMIDDYLKRSSRTVISSIKNDIGKFTNPQIDALIKHESGNKKRTEVLHALNKLKVKPIKKDKPKPESGTMAEEKKEKLSVVILKREDKYRGITLKDKNYMRGREVKVNQEELAYLKANYGKRFTYK